MTCKRDVVKVEYRKAVRVIEIRKDWYRLMEVWLLVDFWMIVDALVVDGESSGDCVGNVQTICISSETWDSETTMTAIHATQSKCSAASLLPESGFTTL